MVRPPYLMTQGIISACAGSTSRRNCATCGSGDHPRMRGEHEVAVAVVYAHVGSSPHARGALDRVRRPRAGPRIIPACAGSTSRRRWPRRCSGDHPRMRGEHMPVRIYDVVPPGSSPHARGALPPLVAQAVVQGIIPACAGSTAQKSSVIIGLEDHPRMRGEHRLAATASTAPSGSSPHARGALVCVLTSGFPRRIIPACAGSTGIMQTGSSPHARGALRVHAESRRRQGIIPACAGSTKRFAS